MDSIEVSAKNIEQAIEIGLFKLEAKREDVKIIVLEEGGLFDKAKVRLILNSAYENQSETDKLINDLLEYTKLNIAANIEETSDTIKVNLSGEDVGVLIGKRGDVLDSLQYILSQIINKDKDKKFKKVILDSEGYRVKREDTLKLLALRTANRAVKENKSIKLEPMNAYERKIIHLAVENRNDVITVSQGEEPNRFVSIMPSTMSASKEKISEKKEIRDFND